MTGSATATDELKAKVEAALGVTLGKKVAVKEGGFTVAHTEDNKAYSVASSYFASEAMANQFLQSQVVANPDLHDALHVIPQYEARS